MVHLLSFLQVGKLTHLLKLFPLRNSTHSIDLLFALYSMTHYLHALWDQPVKQGHRVAVSLWWGWGVARDEGPRNEHE